MTVQNIKNTTQLNSIPEAIEDIRNGKIIMRQD